MRLKATITGMVLAGTVVGCSAMTFGGALGNVWIGQKLDIAVPIQMDAGLSAATLCARADVFHADNKVDGNRVRVLTEPTDRADAVTVRILSSAFVDEPMVTVDLRVGCEREITRRFVLLADLPVDTPPTGRTPSGTNELPAAPWVSPETSPTNPASSTSLPETAATAPGVPPESAPTPAASRKAAAPAVAVARPKPVRAERAPGTPRSAGKSATQMTKTAPPPGGSTGRSRLTLDPLEALVERIQTLESTTQSTALEDLVHASQRIEALQGDIKTLVDQSAKNQAELLAMQVRLKHMEEDHTPQTLTSVLAVLVLLSLGGMALLWKRNADLRRALDDDLPGPAVHAPHPTEANAPWQTSAVIGSDKVALDVDVDLLDLEESGFSEAMEPNPTEQAASAKPALEQPPVTGDLPTHPDFNAGAIYDLIEQAGLFATLGKTKEATDALEKRIRQNANDCPLVFLALLGVAHEHNLKTQFQQFRDEFQQVFNVAVPEFALFKDEGRGLEAYPGLLQHICTLWPGPKVLDVIESCLLRSAWGNNAEAFDLAAFRDLILLHGMAFNLPRQTNSPPRSDGLASEGDSQHLDLDL